MLFLLVIIFLLNRITMNKVKFFLLGLSLCLGTSLLGQRPSATCVADICEGKTIQGVLAPHVWVYGVTDTGVGSISDLMDVDPTNPNPNTETFCVKGVHALCPNHLVQVNVYINNVLTKTKNYARPCGSSASSFNFKFQASEGEIVRVEALAVYNSYSSTVCNCKDLGSAEVEVCHD